MNFLFEVGLEEIPARMIAPAQAELTRRVEDILTRERLLSAGHEIHSYSTPRRLAVLISGVEVAQADTQEQLTGPSWAVAFKNGEPTPAAHAFAKKAGVDLSELQKLVSINKDELMKNLDIKSQLVEQLDVKRQLLGDIDVKSKLARIVNSKGEYLGATVERKGRTASETRKRGR